MSKQSFKVLVLYMPIHVAVVVLTWRDLNRRPVEAVRGSKRLWRVASAANTLGAAAYWLAGRRATTSAAVPA